MIRTTCPYCGVGCGVQVQAQTDGWAVQGDAAHPANLGRLCVKGAALGETLSDHGRLTQPMRRARGAAPQAVSWDAALDEVAAGFARIIDTHGPEAVAFYVSGQLLTEDYYVANKLMKGFIGSANIDTNSRLCMSSAVVGYKRSLGADAPPCSYEDIELADCVMIAGSNMAYAHPVLLERAQVAAAAGLGDRRRLGAGPRRHAGGPLGVGRRLGAAADRLGDGDEVVVADVLDPGLDEQERHHHRGDGGDQPHDHRAGDPCRDSVDLESVTDQRCDQQRDEGGHQPDAAEKCLGIVADHLGDERSEDELGEREDDQSDDETTCVEMEVVEYRRGDDESDGRRDQVDDGADEKTDHALIVGLCRR